jgi:hypothetical protein
MVTDMVMATDMVIAMEINRNSYIINLNYHTHSSVTEVAKL